ncbi:hypothetical protein KSC_103030 [Ktedonobacter sp. SOSP1-52]|nr:hypothetical protein KSC_103030 [Ktedonobacter sp. SOSP1-52]
MLLKLRSIALHSTVNGGVIDAESSFSHEFFEVAVTEGVPQIPSHTDKDDFGLEVTGLSELRTQSEHG